MLAKWWLAGQSPDRLYAPTHGLRIGACPRSIRKARSRRGRYSRRARRGTNVLAVRSSARREAREGELHDGESLGSARDGKLAKVGARASFAFGRPCDGTERH